MANLGNSTTEGPQNQQNLGKIPSVELRSPWSTKYYSLELVNGKFLLESHQQEWHRIKKKKLLSDLKIHFQHEILCAASLITTIAIKQLQCTILLSQCKNGK